MLMQVNGVVRLTKDPEQRYTSDGKSIVTFSVVSNEKYKETETNCFIDCVVFGTLGEKVVMPYLKKASKIYMQGKLKQDTWQDKDGQKRSKHTISVESFEFLEPKATQSQLHQDEYQAQQIPGVSNPPSMNRRIDNIAEDDVPFKRG